MDGIFYLFEKLMIASSEMLTFFPFVIHRNLFDVSMDRCDGWMIHFVERVLSELPFFLVVPMLVLTCEKGAIQTEIIHVIFSKRFFLSLFSDKSQPQNRNEAKHQNNTLTNT